MHSAASDRAAHFSKSREMAHPCLKAFKSQGKKAHFLVGHILIRCILCSHELHPIRLDGGYRLSGDHTSSGLVLSWTLQQERGRLLCLRTQCLVVACRHVHGGDDVCCRHAAGGHWTGVHAGYRGKLAMVGLPSVGNDDGLSLRAALAAFRLAHRCPVRGDALLRQTRRILARLPRRLSRSVDELPHPRLGHESDDQHCGHDVRGQ